MPKLGLLEGTTAPSLSPFSFKSNLSVMPELLKPGQELSPVAMKSPASILMPMQVTPHMTEFTPVSTPSQISLKPMSQAQMTFEPAEPTQGPASSPIKASVMPSSGPFAPTPSALDFFKKAQSLPVSINQMQKDWFVNRAKQVVPGPITPSPVPSPMPEIATSQPLPNVMPSDTSSGSSATDSGSASVGPVTSDAKSSSALLPLVAAGLAFFFLNS